MCNGHNSGESRCERHGSRVRSFIQPRLLLLLAQKPAHGYELMERLSQDEDPGADPGLLYRTLRQFEEDRLLRSSWDTEGRGPARRVYEITDEGLDYLHAWAVNVRRTRERLERFVTEYEAFFSDQNRGGETNAKRG
jgi:PadR family transcriptional regulator PadR